MGSKGIAALLLIGLLLLFSSMSVNAATDTDPLWDIYNKVTGHVLGFVKDFVKAAFEYFWGALGAIFATALNELIKPFKALILWNPEVDALRPFVAAITALRCLFTRSFSQSPARSPRGFSQAQASRALRS